jgi:perosamine synthetase
MPNPLIENDPLIETFASTIRSVAGDAAALPLHTPVIGDTESRFVNECLASTFVSSVGPFVTRFENEIAEYTGSAFAIAVSSGTVGLQVALVLAGVERGDEVVIPSLSFIATANAVVHAGGTPVFVDSDPTTLGMSPAALAELLDGMRRENGGVVNPVTGKRIAAVVPMHTLGHPLDIVGIAEVAAGFGVAVVEDAAESLGSFVGDRHTGTFGAAGVLSFNGNKIVTTGGGGMILTDDPELGRRARHLTTTAKLTHAWEFEHDEVGWNYRMPNLNAALGVAQFSQLEHFLANKRELARRYEAAFADVDGLTFVPAPQGTTSNYWLCAVRLDRPSLELRDALLAAAVENGIQARPFWNLLSDQRMYSSAQSGPLTTARELVESVICLPSSSWLLDQDA